MNDLRLSYPKIRLSACAHKEGVGESCAMDLANLIAGYRHSDEAEPFTCPLIAGLVRMTNDFVSDENRQRLIHYLPRVLGSHGTIADKQARAKIIGKYMIEFLLAPKLERSGFYEIASLFRKMRTWKEVDQTLCHVWSRDEGAVPLDEVLSVDPQSTWHGVHFPRIAAASAAVNGVSAGWQCLGQA